LHTCSEEQKNSLQDQSHIDATVKKPKYYSYMEELTKGLMRQQKKIKKESSREER
jgi:hypothetical protein